MKVLLVCGKHQYGKPQLGLGTEYSAFIPALQRLGHEVEHFEIWDRSHHANFAELNKSLFDTVLVTKPTIILFVLLHFEIWIETFAAIRDQGIATICWTTDDSWKYDIVTRHIGKYFSLVTTTYPYVLSKYRRDGINQVFLTQWAASSSALLPPIPATDCKYAVSFVGADHGNRRDRIEFLRHQGITVNCFGKGWENGSIEASQIPIIMQNSIISLNFANSKGENQLKARTFEVPGAGGFLITDNVADLENFYVGDKEIVIADNNLQLVEKIRYYLNNMEERDKIANAGHSRTTNEHIYEKRLSEIIKVAIEEQKKYQVDMINSNRIFKKAYNTHKMTKALKLFRGVLVKMCTMIWGKERGARAARQIIFELSRRILGARTFSASGFPGRMFYHES